MARGPAGAGAWTIHVENLARVVTGFNRSSKAVGKATRAGLRKSTKPVAALAKSIAAGQGLHSSDPRTSGNLIGRIRPWATNSAAGITETAARKGGFSYPSVYEFGGRGGNAVGPRAFMMPAAERGAPLAEAIVTDEIMNAVESTA